LFIVYGDLKHEGVSALR